LLRKKLEPEVEGWAEEAYEAAKAAGIDPAKLSSDRRGGDYDDDEDDYEDDSGADGPLDPFNEQWADIRHINMEKVKEYIQTQSGKDYTEAERQLGIQNVRTGLRRDLEDDEDEEDDEEEDEDDEEYDKDSDTEDKSGLAKAGILTQAGVSPSGVGALADPEYSFWVAGKPKRPLPINIDIESKRKAKEQNKRAAPAR